MTPEEIKHNIKVMQAYLDGKTVQSRGTAGGEWKDVTTPSFNFNAVKYRVKPDVPEWVGPLTEEGRRKRLVEAQGALSRCVSWGKVSCGDAIEAAYDGICGLIDELDGVEEGK